MLVKDGGDGFDSIREIMFLPSVVKVNSRIETTVAVWFLLHKSRPPFNYFLLCKHSLDLSFDGTGSLRAINNKYAVHVGFGEMIELAKGFEVTVIALESWDQ
jgi:hypothetical protein